jgi:hypothetical protein
VESGAACGVLLGESSSPPNPPPLPASARKRLAELGVDVAGNRGRR